MNCNDFAYEVLPSGDLKIKVLTEDGRDELRGWMQKDPREEIVLSEMCEYMGWSGNSQLCTVAPEWIGALTDAPILTTDVDYDDNGDVSVHPDNKVWWFPNYMVEDCIKTLVEEGEVVFTEAED